MKPRPGSVPDRRDTLASPIPAILAETMVSGQVVPDADVEADAAAGGAGRGEMRDPAAPEVEQPELTRRVGESDRQDMRHISARFSDPDVVAARHRAASHIDEARAALDAGEITQAIVAAEAALVESDTAPPPGIVEVIEPARPLIARVFEAYVGHAGGVPMLAPRAQEIARTRLGEAERAVLARVDGVRTLEQLFDGSGLGSTDALRLAARLIQSGAIRIV